MREIYGPAASELVLPAERPHEKILDLIERPKHYLGVVREIRHVLAERFSYKARLKELFELLEG